MSETRPGRLRISVVTPVFQSEASVARTLRSVSGQTALSDGLVEVQHIVVDGASKDATLEEIERVRTPIVEVVSEPDRGMYDALAKGLRRATGDVVCYLNAGDLLLPAAFETVVGVVRDTDARWFTGTNLLLGPRGVVTRIDSPWRYRRDFLRAGLYGRVLPFVQQESTFWRRELLEQVDLEALAGFKVAGDHFLWKSFAEVSDLDVVHSVFAGFTLEAGQLSQDKARYFGEMEAISGRPGLALRLAAFVEKRRGWWGSAARKERTNPRMIRFDHALQRWTRG